MMTVSHLYSNLLLVAYIFALPRWGATPLPDRLDTAQLFNGFPGEPAACHELKTKSVTSSTPVPSLMLVKMVGPSPLIIFASRSMTARDADTNGAMSICLTVKPRS
jgi:hypothetical protein